MTDWQPSASLDALRKRAQILSKIRAFFAERNVLEVETPCLSHTGVTDVHLHMFETQFSSPIAAKRERLFLQTSPEYAMKRLLCAGSGCIFQLSRAFRNEEAGRVHNPEFTMLEWYRTGFDHHDLMAEVDELMQSVLGTEPAEKVTYRDAFVQALKLDPLDADLASLRQCAQEQGFAEIAAEEEDRDTLLQLLFSMRVEPAIGQQRPTLVYHFPASQAALARLEPGDLRVARRFEMYYRGMELANGFHELADAPEQRARFEAENRQRQVMQRKPIPIDERLLSALEAGLPDCAGVALGIERLLMIALGADKIEQVMAFSVQRA